MQVAVVGSRGYARPGAVAGFVRSLARRHPGCVVVSGGAPGVDSWAAAAARSAGLVVRELPVLEDEWVRFGRSAGPRRNRQLVASLDGGDVLVAFHDLASTGTSNTIRLALTAGLRVFIYGPTGARLEPNDWAQLCLPK